MRMRPTRLLVRAARCNKCGAPGGGAVRPVTATVSVAVTLPHAFPGASLQQCAGAGGAERGRARAAAA